MACLRLSGVNLLRFSLFLVLGLHKIDIPTRSFLSHSHCSPSFLEGSVFSFLLVLLRLDVLGIDTPTFPFPEFVF